MNSLRIVDRDATICQGIQETLHNDRRVTEVTYIHYQDLLEDRIDLDGECTWLVNAKSIPPQDSSRLVRLINDKCPQTKILAFGVPDDPNSVLHLIESGVDCYVRQSTSVNEIIGAWDHMNRGQARVCVDIAGAMLTRIAELAGFRVQSGFSGGAAGPAERLTSRQQEILELISLGLTNAEIAERLFIEVGTVKNHVHNLLDRLDAKNRYEAVAKTQRLAV